MHIGTMTQESLPVFEDEAEASRLVQSPSDVSQKPEIRDIWPARKSSNGSSGRRQPDVHAGGSTRGRQKSISEAFEIIRARRGSVSANAQEIAEALKAPVSFKLILLFVVWYLTSALTNTSSKSILNAFSKPITLSIVQFAFVSFWCIFSAYLASLFPALKGAVPALRNGIRPPSRDVVLTALPLAIFQLTGHILSSTATSLIPVSLVHTIKGLSPLFTVLAYRVFFRIRYARATYLSLIPLTMGVVLACSAGFSSNLFGICCALFGAIVFVTQNIFSKRLFNEAARAEAEGQGNTHSARKLDKLNLLCYCSGLAFLLTAPIWLLTEGFPLLLDVLRDGVIALSNQKGALDHGPLLLEFFLNGIFHFGQNIMAFILLSMVSPVSYSVASLIKRVFVIAVSILWFGSPTTRIQAFGIGLTFLGLYLYDRTSHDDAADRRAKADHFRSREAILPLISETAEPSRWQHSNGHVRASSNNTIRSIGEKISTGYMKGIHSDSKKEDSPVPGRPRFTTAAAPWLPPGTKQESTWELADMVTKS